MPIQHLSQSEENYIKAIYNLTAAGFDSISTNLLADRMQTKASSVTDMLKKLADKELLTYQKYQGCNLTNKGTAVALSVVRKHRLWEVFLVEKLQFGWDEVHEIAEQLEHIQSTELIDKLDAFLGFPKVDPHGDPIPDETGRFDEAVVRVSLGHCDPGTSGIVMGVEDSSADFLQYLSRIELKLGSEIYVQDKLSFDDSVVVVFDQKTVQFSNKVALKIFVRCLDT